MFFVEFVAVAGDLAEGGTKAGGAVTGKTDKAGLLVEGTADCLADPEGGIGGELETLTPVELVYGMLEAKVSFLDEVEQLHAGRQRIAAGNGYDQAKVGADEPVLGHGSSADLTVELAAALAGFFYFASGDALFDDLGELALFGCVEKGNGADFVEVLTY